MSKITPYGAGVPKTNIPEEVNQPTDGRESAPASESADSVMNQQANQKNFGGEAKGMLDLGAGILKKSLQDEMETKESARVMEAGADSASKLNEPKPMNGSVVESLNVKYT